MKKTWQSFCLREKLCLIAGAIGTAAILCLILMNRDYIAAALPYVLLVGAVESFCFGGFLWDRDRKRALLALTLLPVLCIVMAVMFLTGRL